MDEEVKSEIQEMQEEVSVPAKTPWYRHKVAKESFSWAGTIVLAVLLAVFINAYVFRASRVDGRSMQPTLQGGQSVYISRIPYWFNDPAYGDIVVFDSENVDRNFFTEVKESFRYNVITYNVFNVAHPQKYWIKRVIGLPGDTIEIQEDGVYRNGVFLEEDYVYDEEVLDYQDWQGRTWTVGENEIFVMGDNRNHSMDSRDIGVISQNAILGKVVKH